MDLDEYEIETIYYVVLEYIYTMIVMNHVNQMRIIILTCWIQS